jgi:hypothetical protein
MQSAAGRGAGRAQGKLSRARRGFGRVLGRSGGGSVIEAASLRYGVVTNFVMHIRDVKM